jgi:hypothetical protein
LSQYSSDKGKAFRAHCRPIRRGGLCHLERKSRGLFFSSLRADRKGGAAISTTKYASRATRYELFS